MLSVPLLVDREADRVAEERLPLREHLSAANGARVTLLVYDDEGHGFADPRNWVSLSAVTEVFLSQCLGGVHEPIGDALLGSTMRAVRGGEHIPGLAVAALAPPPKARGPESR